MKDDIEHIDKNKPTSQTYVAQKDCEQNSKNKNKNNQNLIDFDLDHEKFSNFENIIENNYTALNITRRHC